MAQTLRVVKKKIESKKNIEVTGNYLILLFNLPLLFNFETSMLDFLSCLHIKLNHVKIITRYSQFEVSKNNIFF
jgi:predicted metal-dependent peptidase